MSDQPFYRFRLVTLMVLTVSLAFIVGRRYGADEMLWAPAICLGLSWVSTLVVALTPPREVPK